MRVELGADLDLSCHKHEVFDSVAFSIPKVVVVNEYVVGQS
jgi:hypothetical protein